MCVCVCVCVCVRAWVGGVCGWAGCVGGRGVWVGRVCGWAGCVGGRGVCMHVTLLTYTDVCIYIHIHILIVA